jgi:putative transposase
MRRSRVTFKGAWHHVVSRALSDESILAGFGSKKYFLRLLADAASTKRIRVLAYCLMRNHYHLIVQNSSGRLADFMRQVNGQYGFYYRHTFGGRGYVFQDRYKSTLIQDDTYLRMALLYVMLNPVRAHLVKNALDYRWSSIRFYFSHISEHWLDNEFAERLFHDRVDFRSQLWSWVNRDLPVRRTRFGLLLGKDGFVDEVKARFDRRKRSGESLRRREDDYSFESPDNVIARFERNKGVRLDALDPSTLDAKRLRGELLVLLRERAGLSYGEIMKLPLFKSLRYSSLGKLYKRFKSRRISR